MNLLEKINGLSEAEIENHNKNELLNADLVFNEFKSDFKKGICNTCGESINSFNLNKFCHHWFLKPQGLKKKNFEKFLKEPIGFFHLETFFRWVANIENPIKAINDLQCEKIGNKLKVVTIKFREIEWTLNYGETDLKGHSTSIHTNFPHFHLQMTYKGKRFIDFGDFHIPFSKDDLEQFNLSLQYPDLLDFRFRNGEGMSQIENLKDFADIEKYLKPTSHSDNAVLNVKSFLMIPKGEIISKEKFNKIDIEAQEKSISKIQLLKQYFPNAIIISELNRGNGVPELKNRKPR